MKMTSWFLAFATLAFMSDTAKAETLDVKWYTVKDGQVELHLHFFWSQTCPHCAKAHPFVADLQTRYPWLKVTTYEITGAPANAAMYRELAKSINRVAGQVPAFFYVKQLEIGFDSAETTGKRLEDALVKYRATLQKKLEEQKPTKPVEKPAPGKMSMSPEEMLPILLVMLSAGEPIGSLEEEIDLKLEEILPPEEHPVVDVPGWGAIQSREFSLPVLTVVIGGLDAFNPCAFFVLMILMSLMLRTGSRKRMMLVGGVFVSVSGLVYFLFMAAWLNLFFLIGHLRIITLAAGLLALTAAIINIKDFFWFKQGVSLSLPDSAKPGLFQRMNQLIVKGSFVGVIAGTSVLAFLTNMYELLCTSGLPLVYTRILTLREMPPMAYYGYLVLYNVVYVLPLFVIVMGFALTLSSHKLTEYQGRILKLLSGMMMLALGVLLVFRPETLSSFSGAILTLLGAIVGTALIVVAHRLLAYQPPTLKLPVRKTGH